MKKQIVFLLFLFISLGTFATNNEREVKKTRTVCGKVSDANGEAIPGAAIKIVETGETIFADMEGSYKISLPADQNCTLEVNTIGFQPIQIQSSQLSTFGELVLKSL